MPNLKEILQSINYLKNDDLIDDFNSSDYVPYVINKIFSYFPETILLSNEMNKNWHLDKKIQYKYYVNGVRKGKRYSPWLKIENNEDVDLVSKYYGVSKRIAREYLKILSASELENIRNILKTGEK
jgi:hypothetical protein